MSRYQWVLIGLLTGFWGLVGINRLGIGYLLPAIVKPFHMSQLQAGLLISGTSFTWAFSSWASGWLSDRYGRRRVLLPGAAFACAATAAMGAAWNWLSMFVVRDLIGIGDGVGWPSGQSTLAEEVPAERRALVSGIFTAGYPLFGSVIGAVVITSLAAGLGWRWVFPILAAVFLVVVLALWLVMREPKRSSIPDRLDWRNAIKMVRDHRVVVLMLIQSAALGWLQVGVLFNTQWLVKVRHVSLVEAGVILAIAGGIGVIGTLLLPFLSDYVGRKPMMMLGGILCAVMLTLYLFGGFPLGLSVALLALNAFFIAVVIPLGSATCIVEMVGEDVRATSMGVVNFVGVMIGTFALPAIAGLVADGFGMRTGFAIAALCALLAGLLAIAIPETAPRVLARRRPAPVVASA
jgi:predicted MFS family arabinose efflux permease